MKEYTTFLLAQQKLQQRFDKLSGRGVYLRGMLNQPHVGAVLVGGPRNKSAALPALTRQGINAALRSAVRAEKAVQARMANA